MIGKELILWSVRIALCCYAVFFCRAFSRRFSSGTAQGQSVKGNRWWYTLTGLMFGLHFAAAFHFRHHWDHQQAFVHTAQRTREMLGWEFGYGLYFNYFFLVLWAMELVWWWGSAQTYLQRARWISVSIHTYLLFVIVNGAVVFVSGPTRWVSFLVLCLVGILSVRRLLGKTE